MLYSSCQRIDVTFYLYPNLSSVIFSQLGLSPLLFCEDHSSGKEQQKKSTPQEQSPAALKLLESSAEAQEEMEIESKPRLCVLQRSPMGFGFHLGWVQQKPGTFINRV